MNTPTKLLSLAAAISVSGCTVNISSQPTDSPAVVEATPQMDVVTEADVPFVEVDEYFFVGGHYYYWHPGVNRYVLLRGEPPAGHRISRMDHLEARDRMGRRVAPQPSARREPAPAPQQKKAEVDPKKKKKENGQ